MPTEPGEGVVDADDHGAEASGDGLACPFDVVLGASGLAAEAVGSRQVVHERIAL